MADRFLCKGGGMGTKFGDKGSFWICLCRRAMAIVQFRNHLDPAILMETKMRFHGYQYADADPATPWPML